MNASACEAGLLADILANPEDDTPRLILADYLTDHGQEARAEFIRIQCLIASLQGGCLCGSCVRRRGGVQYHNGSCAVDRGRPSPRRREQELLNLPCDRGCPWHAPLPHSHKSWVWLYRRGFVGFVICPCAGWLAHGPTIVRAQPAREVQLVDRRPRRFQAVTAVGCYGWDVDLPGCIYERLRPPSVGYNLWPTEAAARAALSAACLDWARSAHPTASRPDPGPCPSPTTVHAPPTTADLFCPPPVDD